MTSIDGDGGSGSQAPPTGTDPSILSLLAQDLLAAAIATRRSEALLVRAQAAHLTWLSQGDRALDCGFTSLSSLALNILGLRPRTTRERLALDRLFVRAPSAERAFLQGRLSACQALAAAPLLEQRDPSEEAVERWVSQASEQSVRMLRYEVRRVRAEKTQQALRERREKRAEPTETAEKADRAQRAEGGLDASIEDAPDETPGRTVTIRGPLGFQIVFDQMMELARMVLGFDAPEYICIDAILMETGARGICDEERRLAREKGIGPGEQDAQELSPPPPIRVRPRDTVPVRMEAIAHARETLRQVKQYITDVEELIESGAPSTPNAALQALRQIQLLRAPQRVLFAHLIRDLRRTGIVDQLGYRNMTDLVEDRLQLCERSARNRVAESILLEGDAGIEEAYGRGEISLMQAHLIRRLARMGTLRPFVDRARQVTWRQLQREYRLLELLKKCHLESVAREPLPQARVEEALIEALGGEREKIEAALRKRGIPALAPDSSTDPAENPVLMERLEALVEMLAFQHWDYLPTEDTRDRQMSAVLRREVTVRFWAPESIAEDLESVLRRLRKKDGRRLPYWAAAVFLFAEATEAWHREDPERRPARVKILRRDGYRCVIPGCTRRDRLETSHNRPKSLGGTNDPQNLSTVCHAHHQHGLHRGRIRIGGKAPHALRFELGCRPDGPPMMILRGNKIVKGAFDPVIDDATM